MQDCTDSDILTVTTTVGSAEAARELARALVHERLAACVQVDEGIVSFYRWEGRLCEETESRLVIKTTVAREPALRDFIAQKHPYDLPQYTAVPMRASHSYASWVRGEVAPGAAA